MLLASSQIFLVAHCLPWRPDTRLLFTSGSELVARSSGKITLTVNSTGLRDPETPSVKQGRFLHPWAWANIFNASYPVNSKEENINPLRFYHLPLV